MKVRKFVSAISALTIAASAFAGMAVTASAAGSQLDVVELTEVSDRVNITKNQVIGETIVYEFDVYVPDGTKTQFAYYSSGNLGPTFFLDAKKEAGKVWVQYQTAQSGPYDINSNTPYSWYLADSWAHVAITNKIESDGSIGNSTVQLSSVDGDDTPFTQTKDDGTTTVRHPYNSREIVHRNIYGGRLWNNIRFTIDNAETDGVQITNQKIYTVASKLTVDAPNATITGLPTDTRSYDPTSGLIADNTYALTVTANDNYTLDSVVVNDNAVEAVNGVYTVTVSGDTTITVNTTEKPSLEPEPEEPTSVTASAELVQDFTDAGDLASVWQATLVNNTKFQLSSVEATATATDKTTAPGSGTVTEVAPGSNVVIAVVVDKASTELSGVSVTLK